MKKLESIKSFVEYKCDYCDFKDTHEWSAKRHEQEEHLCKHAFTVKTLHHRSGSHDDDPRYFEINTECVKCSKSLKNVNLDILDEEHQIFLSTLEAIFEKMLINRPR